MGFIIHSSVCSLQTKKEVQNAARSAMNDKDVQKAAVNAMVGSYTNNPNQAKNNQSLFKALAKNKDVQNAAVTVAKDKKVQKAAWNQAKKNAPLMKSAAIGAFKFGMAAHKASKSNNNNNSSGKY